MTTAYAPTLPASTDRQDPAARLGRVAAGLALATAAVHLLLLRDGTSAQALAMVAMALACLPCAWHLWRRPTARVWAVTAAADVAMGVLHLRMLGGHSGGAASGEPMAHVHHMHMEATPAPASALMWLALALVAAQLAVAAAAAVHRSVPDRNQPFTQRQQPSRSREEQAGQR